MSRRGETEVQPARSRGRRRSIYTVLGGGCTQHTGGHGARLQSWLSTKVRLACDWLARVSDLARWPEPVGLSEKDRTSPSWTPLDFLSAFVPHPFLLNGHRSPWSPAARFGFGDAAVPDWCPGKPAGQGTSHHRFRRCTVLGGLDGLPAGWVVGDIAGEAKMAPSSVPARVLLAGSE